MQHSFAHEITSLKVLDHWLMKFVNFTLLLIVVDDLRLRVLRESYEVKDPEHCFFV